MQQQISDKEKINIILRLYILNLLVPFGVSFIKIQEEEAAPGRTAENLRGAVYRCLLNGYVPVLGVFD